jgi:hypothetical protein
MTMWTSKLGAKFPRSDIERLDAAHHRELKRLRSIPGNSRCAECQEPDVCWASVSLGVFLCVRCSDVHRALGTHISKVKGCSGTYLWGPDEIARMQELGNHAAQRIYGAAPVPAAGAGKDERLRICREKYEQRKWAANLQEQEVPALPQSVPVATRTVGPVAPVHARVLTPGHAQPESAKARVADFDIDAIFDALHGGEAASHERSQVSPERPLDDFLDQCLQSSPAQKKQSVPAKTSKANPVADFWADFAEW